jgi:peptide-methionine (S)-S-oxide reductase
VKKILILFFFLQTSVYSQNLERAYFAGGCFWCMEESFEKKNGVTEVISGYSCCTISNPTYEEVTYGNTGHFEVIEVIYDKNKTNFKDLLDHFWINIDPFDQYGQFCDKGYSYRSVAFYQNQEQKNFIENSIMALEEKFNKKIVTYVREFDKFYKAEAIHQDYYREKFLNYLRYKKACGRERILNRIWNK